MRLSLRVFLGFFLVVGLAAYFLLSTFLEEVRPGVRQGMEVALVDTANLLAEMASEDLRAGALREGRFAAAIQGFRERRPNARIWGMDKRRSEFRVYVTDAAGRLVFDTAGGLPGEDYSRWNDVYRTLRGEYGARSTRTNPKDESTSVMHVAAPVLHEGKLIGVLTVASPTAGVLPYAQRSRDRVLKAGLLLMGTALAVGLGLAWWLSRSIGRLGAYARGVAEGRKVAVPALGGELADLGRALEGMREKLEGRQYAERYVQTLTHEMKSPLAGIRGAAELLEEPMPEADRQRFLANIRDQEARLRTLLDRLLDLAALQHRPHLQDPVPVSLGDVVRSVLAGKASRLAQRGLAVDVQVPPEARVLGEAFLLEQALSNLVDNALEFSPAGGTLAVGLESEGALSILTVTDQGPGIPDYAQARVMEPFYSLPRPDTGRKSTGLGLSFVAEVAGLHGGRVDLVNLPGGGAQARLTLPRG